MAVRTVDDRRQEIDGLLMLAFGPPGPYRVQRLADAGGHRGVFSEVVRVTLDWLDGPGPPSVVVKLPAVGANDEAALRSGAYEREALAYRELVADTPVATPRALAVQRDPAGRTALVLEDLGHHRAVDQMDGLGADDALAVARTLRRLHDHWRDDDRLAELPIRRSVPEQLPPEALSAGLAALDRRWADVVDPTRRRSFARLVEDRVAVAAAFATAAPPTLCHGDPRADNLVFRSDGTPVLFDWQQLAVQMGPADLAWLAATSLTPSLRRGIDEQLVRAYGTTMDRYQLGMVLPGLAVLLLAQRQLDDDRARRFVATSLVRIATALDDLDPAALAAG